MWLHPIQKFYFEQLHVLLIDGAAVNPNGIKTVLANSLSTFFIEGKPVFSNGNKSLLKNPADPPSLCN